MRKLLLAASMLFTALSATAQAQTGEPTYALDRGSLIIGGEASFTSSGIDGDDDRTTTLMVNPAVQYFVRPRLALGGELNLARYSVGDQSVTLFGVGPRITYFFGGPDTRLHPLLSGSVSWVRSSYGDDQSDSQAGYRAAAGALYRLTRSVGITGELFYQGEIENSDEDLGLNTFGLQFGIAAFVF